MGVVAGVPGYTQAVGPGTMIQLMGAGSFRVTGWSNGQPRASGAGYGLRVRKQDRNRLFDRGWTSVGLQLGGDVEAEVRLSESFWQGCSELRSAVVVGGWWPRHLRRGRWASRLRLR